jgi:ANTAR domain/GAF domain
VRTDHTARVWAAIHACALHRGERVSVSHACIACSRAMRAQGTGLTMLRSGEQREPVYATGPNSQDLEELQFTLGEGPGVEALRTGRPVLAPDLGSALAEHRWPAFAPAAVQRGARAIFAVPVTAGAIRLGVLDVYRREPGLLSSAELADALIFADAVLVLAIDERGGVTTGLKELIEVSFAERRARVHQAAGMVAAQLGVDIADAFARLRAQAYLLDRQLGEVAADVVAGRLGFSPDGGAAPGPRTGDGNEGKGVR